MLAHVVHRTLPAQPSTAAVSYPSDCLPLTVGRHRAFLFRQEPGGGRNTWSGSSDMWGTGELSPCAEHSEIDSSAFSLDTRERILAGNLKQRDSFQELQRGDSQRAWPCRPGVDEGLGGRTLGLRLSSHPFVFTKEWSVLPPKAHGKV